MKKCALYRCKQCFATMTDEGGTRINKDFIDWMFNNEIKENEIDSIATFKKVLIHYCNDNTVGLCEFIGWKEIEK